VDSVKIGVVVPVLNQYKLSLEALWSVRTVHDWEPFIIDNWRNPRSVAASWNEGLTQSFKKGCDYTLVINDDVVLSPWTIDNQVEYLTDQNKIDADVRMTTGHAVGNEGNDRKMLNWPEPPEDGPSVRGADFACFMIGPELFNEIGPFDENLKPAYFEDNDYHRRILLAGYKAEIVTTAPYLHYGSRTQKESGVVNSYQFDINKQYYKNKWGGAPGAEIYATPYNDPNFKLSDWTEPG
jgi:GT2 family glycosyltransferase